MEGLQEQLESYCKVARKRIVDVLLLQTTERHMIKGTHLYFRILTAVDDNAITGHEYINLAWEKVRICTHITMIICSLVPMGTDELGVR